MVNLSKLAIQYRLYPNEIQLTYFKQFFGCTRKLWNLSLSYVAAGELYPPTKYKAEYPYLRKVDSLALCATYMQLKQAIVNGKDKRRALS